MENNNNGKEFLSKEIVREQRSAVGYVINEGYGDWVYSSVSIQIPDGWHYYNHIEQGPNTANPQEGAGSWSHEVTVQRDRNGRIITVTMKLGARGRSTFEGRIWLGYTLVVIIEQNASE